MAASIGGGCDEAGPSWGAPFLGAVPAPVAARSGWAPGRMGCDAGAAAPPPFTAPEPGPRCLPVAEGPANARAKGGGGVYETTMGYSPCGGAPPSWG